MFPHFFWLESIFHLHAITTYQLPLFSIGDWLQIHTKLSFSKLEKPCGAAQQ
jgi:hypothetical protein